MPAARPIFCPPNGRVIDPANEGLRIANARPRSQGGLIVERRLVPVDPGFAQPLQDRADVLVLVFDRAATAADLRLQLPIVIRLAVRFICEFLRQHREIVRDDHVVLAFRPVPSPHRAKLAAAALVVSYHSTLPPPPRVGTA